jgi:methylenetetrahydrofolate dehydrogenase (NADP+) / methenyltetrahydrofolate cyclohydrolase
MECKLIDGKQISLEVRDEVAQRAKVLLEKTGKKPGLATVLVGSDPASETYVRMKHKACEKAGIESFGVVLDADTSQQELESKVEQLANDDQVHGILVQLPLPSHIDAETVLSKIPLEKDVDGFHPMNAGLLARRGCEPFFVPCTPWGCIVMLERCGVEISGKRAVVLGRSNIVGLPMALLLQERNATVTVVHSRTQNAEALMREADILVAAIGKPEMVKADMIKEGAAVIDVGINKVEDASRPRGYRLVGDVDFESAKQKAGWLTPVPGGVGPMTIAILLENTVKAAERALSGAPSLG